MEIICNKEECTGCSMCFNICPQKCIFMEEDKYGYMYPVIDKNNCIDCGLCKKKCPAINKSSFTIPQKTYASWSLEKSDKDTCTSGGMATVFSRKILKKGGSVYGATWENDGGVRHNRITEMEQIEKLKGSKYVHSYLGNMYQRIQEDINYGKNVIFIGTPCQVAGVKSYLGKDYKNFYSIDLICHGVASQKFLKEYLISKLKNVEIERINFRTVEGYQLEVINNNQILYKESVDDSLYLIGFLKGLFNRESCYQCQYSQKKRCSDITIGDFWGIGMMDPFKHERRDSISVTLINTDKGKMLFKECEKYIFFEERKLLEAVYGNEQLRHPATRHKNYFLFRKLYEKKGFIYSAKKALRKDIVMAPIKKILKKNEKMYYKIKKIIQRGG